MIHLVADKQNPAQFFGACGFLELADWLVPGVVSVWRNDGLEIQVESAVFDAVLGMIERCEIDERIDWKGKDNVKPLDLIDNQTGFRMRLDWWQSREDSEKNSIWKCFSGQMTSKKVTADMLDICRVCIPETTPENIFSDMSRPATGRFGFDPRSAWNAIDAGTSINDWKDSSVATYGFCEFLTSLAAQTIPLKYAGSKKYGFYCLWEKAYPLSLSRLAAAGLLSESGKVYRFDRTMRGQGFSSFSYSVLIPTNPINNGE